MAGKIREFMHEYVRNEEGQKIFIFRQVNGWTNIALDATEANPKLTADPITTLIKASTEFAKCSAVSKVEIKWSGTDEILGFDDIAMMESQFDPLPVKTDDADVVDTTKQTDAEVLFEHIKALEDKVDTLDVKLSQLIENVDKLSSSTGPSTSSSSPSRRVILDDEEPAMPSPVTKAQGKKRSRA